MLLSPFQSGWRTDTHSPHGREENINDIIDESCVRKSIEEPISCCAQNRRCVCGPCQSTAYSSEQGSAVAKTARRLENEEVIDKFRNLRELPGLRRPLVR